MSKDVYDLLVGHEVSHALHTPRLSLKEEGEKIDPDNGDALAKYYNVVEDARIERMIKGKFKGLRRCMYRGYKELIEKDVFKIGDRPLESFGFIDRLNLHCKIGNLVDIPFKSDTEREFVKRTENSRSWEDVDQIVKDLYEFVQERGDLSDFMEVPVYVMEDPNGLPVEGQGGEGGEGDEEKVGISSEGEGDGQPQSGDDENTDDEGQPSQSDVVGDGSPVSTKLLLKSSETQQSFDESIKNSHCNEFSPETTYISIPNVDVNSYVDGWKEVHKGLDKFFTPTEKVENLEKFKTFRKDHMKTVNYLVKEFELKKNADQHARASVSKTGVVDTNKLHSYRFNEDLFKRVTTLPGGKNHGLIMFVDFSGSMQNCMQDTINQLIVLSMFCDKVKIPFDVYSFTTCGHSMKHLQSTEEDVRSLEKRHAKEKDFHLGYFRLRQYFSSEMNTRQFNNALVNMIGVSEHYEGWSSGYGLPEVDQLGSTPLNQCIAIAHKLIPVFQKRYGIQKVTSVFLTDGESDSMDHKWEMVDGELTANYFSSWGKMVIHDPVTRIDYECNGRSDVTDALLQSIRDRHEIEVVGFYIAVDPYSVRNIVSRMHEGFISKTDPVMKDIIKIMKTERCYVINDVPVGYSEFYILGGSKDSLKVDSEELVLDMEKTRRVRINQFKKHMKSKTLNKVLLNNFVDIIS